MGTLVAFVVLGAASLLLHSSKAAVYEVGDSTGWQAPSSTSFYSNWASGKNFTVGDTLSKFGTRRTLVLQHSISLPVILNCQFLS